MATGNSIVLSETAASVVAQIEMENGLVQFPDHLRGLGIAGMGTVAEVTMKIASQERSRPYVRLLFVKGLPFTAKIRGRHAGSAYQQLRGSVHDLARKHDFRL